MSEFEESLTPTEAIPNTEVFWAAITCETVDDAFMWGSEVNGRLHTMLANFHEIISSGNDVPHDSLEEYYALRDAKDHCDGLFYDNPARANRDGQTTPIIRTRNP